MHGQNLPKTHKQGKRMTATKPEDNEQKPKHADRQKHKPIQDTFHSKTTSNNTNTQNGANNQDHHTRAQPKKTTDRTTHMTGRPARHSATAAASTRKRSRTPKPAPQTKINHHKPIPADRPQPNAAPGKPTTRGGPEKDEPKKTNDPTPAR
ncbi:uncharacterized protein BDZ99DRAFT_525097 [Mytilinidion resinicola]|uniref:Uncharacterized protein n=1 Tax=Mytilinidion resinicola TaxID=574789 RepID=A0A6A6YC33_9PEZI|nr:uncharacterized protein BDZ99DRAFT_525097 [Mytilinidion resinicola]KAF2805397.1 hypothetical protein BDZ99DRAFT_525097 [Mytilinidion resinicola]